ncbi:MAG: helix-hairpin-helix domain-containing protein [bacterium]|nr:helix-hairpin-helix domain-containing protein [bacterium]
MNTTDTAKFLFTIAKQEQLIRPEISIYPKPKALTLKKELERILEAFPGIGPKLTHELLTRYKSLSEILLASQEELAKVPLIGKKKASKIKEILNNRI